MLVSEAAATAIFTITRLLYASALGIVTIVVFSKLPGGSSTKFWYEQPDIVAKITSFFHPFGPTGKRGVKSTNVIAVICLFLTLALNVLPTILSRLSPITIVDVPGNINSTLSPISNVFIPTLTDVNLPQLSVPQSSRDATTKFLCSHIQGGCTDARNNTVAKIIWDSVNIQPLWFFRNISNTGLLISLNDSLATATTPPQYLQLARNSLGGEFDYINSLSFQHWHINNLTGFYSDAYSSNLANNSFSKYDILNSDQLVPLDTPDLSEMLKQGRRIGEPLPTGGDINRAERWSAIHRTDTLSSVLWQSANAHSGQVGSDWMTNCFFCQLIGIQRNSAEANTIYESLTTHNNSDRNRNTFAIQSYIDQGSRLSTVLCTVEYNHTTTGISYWCLHTYSQIWNVYHEHNPYAFFGSYGDSALETEQFSAQSSTPFPFFPPPNVTNPRTYVPVVPIFEIRSKGKCRSDWNFHDQTVQDWMKECANDNLGQLSPASLTEVALNVWQLSSTITVGGFLVTAQYFTHNVGIDITLPAIVIIGAGLFFCVFGNLIVNFITSPVHRRSLYESIRTMTPDSNDPYNVQRLLFGLAPTNTLRVVDSSFDKRISYLKLNNRMIVTLSEEQMSQQDMFIRDSNKQDYLSDKEPQDWSRKHLINL
ncbi:hypothetical protein BD560DRAFT_385621 [Blakeslea trispora]|nr:hypothetical protein BD560DRAFT_385621 [Blakeslea trispora]